MSQPGIPDICPKITLNREEAVTLLLASIAMEEMGLAHILNAEGEKIQKILESKSAGRADLGQIIAANQSIERVIKSITRLQLILAEKLETVAALIPQPPYPPPCPKPTPKTACYLLGEGSGYIKNSRDDYAGAKAILQAFAQSDHRFPFKYALSKRIKSGLICVTLLPMAEGLVTLCSESADPRLFEMWGKGIMRAQMPCLKHEEAVVDFYLRVWQSACRTKFRLKTWRRGCDIFNHDSGVVTVTKGNLRIKVLRD